MPEMSLGRGESGTGKAPPPTDSGADKAADYTRAPASPLSLSLAGIPKARESEAFLLKVEGNSLGKEEREREEEGGMEQGRERAQRREQERPTD